jgi:hypothetical protein
MKAKLRLTREERAALRGIMIDILPSLKGGDSYWLTC